MVKIDLTSEPDDTARELIEKNQVKGASAFMFVEHDDRERGGLRMVDYRPP